MLIAQITDTHIREAGELCYDKVDTAPFLERAVAKLNALSPRPDLVVATGDLVDMATEGEYRRLKSLLAPLEIPLYLVVGNHDHRDHLRAVFPEHKYLPGGKFIHYTVEHLTVRLIVLDTNIPRQGAGELCAERLAWLDARLAEQPKRPTAIVMHHPPFRTGIVKMDELGLSGIEGFERVVSKYDCVQSILCGHLHRAIQARVGGTMAQTCPSTAHQMYFGIGEGSIWGFAFEPPAIQLHWWNDRSLVTHTVLIERFDGPYSFRGGVPIPI